MEEWDGWGGWGCGRGVVGSGGGNHAEQQQTHAAVPILLLLQQWVVVVRLAGDQCALSTPPTPPQMAHEQRLVSYMGRLEKGPKGP